MTSRPIPPPSWYILQEINSRWEQVDTWLSREFTVASEYRSFVYDRAQGIPDLYLRANTRVKACQRMESRFDELDDMLEEWKKAYTSAKKELINHEELGVYAEKIKPFVLEDMKNESLKRLQHHLEKGVERGEKEKKRIRRYDERNRSIPQTDSKKETFDEGSGD